MPSAPDVSIIVVSWNTRELLRECLQSIQSSAGDVSHEVIVVDNASHDGSGEMVRTAFPTVRLIQNADNHGFAAANNQGIEISTGRYVLLLNSDTIVLDGAVAKSAAFADEHRDAAVVGCRTTFPDGRMQRNCFLFPSVLNVFLTVTKLAQRFKSSRFFGRYRFGWWDYLSAREVDGVAGCFMLVRRSAIERVGLMAEHYFMYAEDADWCWRFRQAGLSVWYTPVPHIIHLHDASASQAATAMRVHYRKSLLAFIELRSGLLARWICNLIFGASTLFAAVSALVAEVVRNGAKSDRQKLWPGIVACMKLHLRELFPWRPPDGSDPGFSGRAASFFKRVATLSISGTCHLFGCVRRWCTNDHSSPAVVLYYHGVTAAQQDRFRRQVTWLRSTGTVAPLSNLTRDAQRKVGVTFDDGFENVRQFALPVLQELDVPATIFAVSGNLGRTPQWTIPNGHADTHERLMTANALAAIHDERFEIGSHTVSHPRLARQSSDDVLMELRQSKENLERLLGRRVPFLSIPYGDWDPTTLEVAKKTGYERVYTSDPQCVTSPAESYTVGRFAVSPDDWMWEFKLKALGAYAWKRVLRPTPVVAPPAFVQHPSQELEESSPSRPRGASRSAPNRELVTENT